MKKIKGYKAFNKGLKCSDYQFEENKVFKHDEELKLCEKGFHFCENPLDLLSYYNLCDSEFAEVESLGKIKKAKDDTKIVTDEIKIKTKIDLPAFIKASIDFLFSKIKKVNNGNFSKHASSGDCSQHASSGNFSKHASSGDCSQHELNGKNSIAMACGCGSKMKGKKGNWIVLAEYDNSGKVIAVVSAKIDGNKIKEDIWYGVKNGKFVELN